MQKLLRLMAGCGVCLAFVATTVYAEDVKYLAHGYQSFAEIIALTESAQHSIDLVTFIFDPCHASTQVLLEVLTRKAQQGVRVRLLLDAVPQWSRLGQKTNLANFLAKTGIEVRYYNGSLLLNPFVNLRLHAKFLLVDGASYVSGGRNISDEYFGMSATQNWVDRDVMVTGPSARQAAVNFNELWAAKMVERPVGQPRNFKEWTRFCKTDFNSRATEIQNYFRKNGRMIRANTPTRSCSQVSFVADSPHFADSRFGALPIRGEQLGSFMNAKRLKIKRATDRVLSFLNGARRELQLENWSYMPLWRLDDTFKSLRARRVPVDVITNLDMDGEPEILRQAEEYANHKFSRRDSRGSQSVRQVSSRQDLHDAFALTPASARFMVHSKVITRDASDVAVGSFNIDPRSYNINLESVVVVDDCPRLAEDAFASWTSLQVLYDDDARRGRLPKLEFISPLAVLFAALNLTNF